MGVTVATTRVAARVAGGNQTIRTTDLGGQIPKAAFFTIVRCWSDGTPRAIAIMGMGAATATDEQWAVSVGSRTTQSPSDTNRRAMTDECVLLIFGGGEHRR